MQTDNARLGAELRSAREEADASRRGLQDVTAELEVHAAAAGKRQQELLDAKALQRRLQVRFDASVVGGERGMQKEMWRGRKRERERDRGREKGTGTGRGVEGEDMEEVATVQLGICRHTSWFE
jgi:hypothetical protein